MPIFRAEKYLAETLDTVLAQTFPDWEAVIMDGGSEDGTPDILQRYAEKDSRIRFWSEPDEGPYHAVHKALKEARGEFVCVLCASDGWRDKDWLRSCVEVMDRDPEVSLVWGIPTLVDENGKDLGLSFMFSRFLDERSNGRLGQMLKSVLLRINPIHPVRSARNLIRLMKPANLKAGASFIKNSKPLQKRDWFKYWLETGVLFPDNAMFMDKKMFIACLSPYHPGTRESGDWMSFFYEVNARGYLSYCLPRIVSFVHINPGQVSDKFLEYNRRSRDTYLPRIAQLKRRLKSEPMCFRDRLGNTIK